VYVHALSVEINGNTCTRRIKAKRPENSIAQMSYYGNNKVVRRRVGGGGTEALILQLRSAPGHFLERDGDK